MLRGSVLAFLLLLAAASAARAADELKGLEGAWVVTRALDGSREGLFDGPLNGALFIFKNKRLVVVTSDNEASGGPSTASEGGKEGRHLDFTFKGVRVKGIYKHDAKGVTLCFDRRGKERPGGFDAGAGRPDVVLLRLEKKDTGEGVRERALARKAAEGFLKALTTLRTGGDTVKRLAPFCVKDSTEPAYWYYLQLPGSERTIRMSHDLTEATLFEEAAAVTDDEAIFEGTLAGALHTANFQVILKREAGSRWLVRSFIPTYTGIGLPPSSPLGGDLDDGATNELIGKVKDKAAKNIGSSALALGGQGTKAREATPALLERLDAIVGSRRDRDKSLPEEKFDEMVAIVVALGNIGASDDEKRADLAVTLGSKVKVVEGVVWSSDRSKRCSQHREALAVALGKIGGDEALRILKTLGGDTQPNVRRAAAASLKRLLAAKKDKK
jgi:hypothetical protein